MVNVNTVYTTTLSILNKEQRGYLTPDEFNKVSTQVQLDMFNKMFDDYSQFLRMPETETEFASKIDQAYDDIQIFEETNIASAVVAGVGNTTVYKEPGPSSSPAKPAVYRLGSVYFTAVHSSPEIAIMDKRGFNQQILSPILQPSVDFPIATYQKNELTVYPKSPKLSPQASDVTFNYVRKPKDVVWGYGVGDLGQYIWDGSPGFNLPLVGNPSQDFELNGTLQTEIILEILKYTGVIIKDPSVVQAAAGELQANEANKKA